ncbi:MAG: hypothetical protein K2G37_05000 [Clostridia bacterium]|nr:hypothetical protein [Clostridia bacterium]MDE7328577.1 hypothetical protein [Clostridia bacterium]
MISLKKRTGILATLVVIAVLLLVASCFVYVEGALADTNTDNTYNYFYNQITNDPIAERFYKAFETLYANGEFKDGKLQYDLIANGVATEDEVKAYVNGGDNNRLAKSYGIGRDAFYMDHPDLFYIDVFSTSITAGMQKGKYVAYLDSSRVVSLYTGSSINSKSKVNKAIDEYENKISSIVAEANKLDSVVEKIEYVNDYICKNNTYGFGIEVKDGRNVDTPKADYIYTSYGALVNKESVCEGYAKSFKAVMDRLGIPCVCVQGYAGDHEKMNPHMWNYVQVEGMWYAVDVTYNASNTGNPYMLLGNDAMVEDHVEDGVVSSSGYELRYPALKPYNYGSDEDKNGMAVVGSYTQTDNMGTILEISVSYKGKGARVLQEEGKYLAYSFSRRDYGNNKIVWTEWTNIVAVNEALGTEYYTITDTETKMQLSAGVEHVKFALFDYAPDIDGNSLGIISPTGDAIVMYNPENLTEEHFVCKESSPYRNEGFDSYNPAPSALSITPSNTGRLKYNQTYEVELVYDEKLELDAGFTVDTIGMDLEASLGNSTINQYTKIENFAWDGDKTITFTLTPSQMYIHVGAFYYFTPKGLVGAISKKVPNPVTYSFQGKTVVCSKVFNDGRLYMLMYGAPSLIDNTDVSITDFKDENGNYFAESQRSQLLLVASKKSGEEEQDMVDTLKEETGIVDSDIVTSSSYEIDLQLCGCVQTVPNGSYMQVSFGFPEGYDPDDKDTTYKIYHYKHDDKGNIIGVEEIPLIITQYGLIARVTSFSPFTIVQIKNTSVAVTESATANVYAYVNGGTGGKITSDGKSASGISQVSDTIVYNITPDKGYTTACVLLNGKIVDAKKYSDGKLTLSKSELESSNMLEVRFMSQEIANDYARKGMSISFNGELTESFGGNASNNVAGIIIGCCVAVVVVAVAALVIWFVMKKKKEQKAVATVGAKAQTKSSAVTKSTVAKQSKPTATKSTATTASKTAPTKSTASTASKSTAAKPTATKSTATSASKTAPTKSTASTAGKATASKPTATKSTATSASKTATTKSTASKATSTKSTAKTSKTTSTTKTTSSKKK